MVSRKRRLGVVSIIVSVLFFFIWVTGVIAQDKAVRLKLHVIVPSTHVAYPPSAELAKRLTEASKGLYRVEAFPVGVIGTAMESYAMCRDGLADLSLICVGYTPGQFPLSGFWELPMINLTGVLGTQLLREIYKKGLLDQEYSEVRLVSPAALSPAQVFSNKKITRIEDFKGMRITGSGSINRLWKEMGVQPVMMNYPDVYLALSRKTIDAATSSWAAAAGWRWQEVTEYPIQINLLGGFNCPAIMNKKIWQSLPKDIQEKWSEIFDWYSHNLSKTYDDAEGQAKQAFQAAGRTITEFDPAEYARLGVLAIPIWQEWINAQEKAKRPGKEIYMAYVEMMRKLGKPVAVKVPGLYRD